jgi:hypothetical protein
VQRLFNVAPNQFLVIHEPSQLNVGKKPGSQTIALMLTGGPGRVYEIERSADLHRWEEVQSVTNLNVRQEFEVGLETAGSTFFRSREKH